LIVHLSATAAGFIEDQSASNPREPFKIVSRTRYIVPNVVTSNGYLDGLHLPMFRQTFLKSAGPADPLWDDIWDDSLLDVEASTRSTFQHLHSITIIPAPRQGPVQLIHPFIALHDIDR